MIFDTHAHYDDEAYDKDREAVLSILREKGVKTVVNVGASIDSAKRAVELSDTYDFIYAAVGVHPSDVADLTEEDMKWLIEASKLKKVVAIGEIGLDYHYDEPEKELQKKWFVRQLEVAREVKLPICIHSRDAAQDTLDIMRAAHAEEIGGVIHCYSYGWDMAKLYLDMGFYLGIGGVVTFKNGKKLKNVVQQTPIDRLVLETDAPYLSPEPYRGQRNSSERLIYVASQIAELKDMTTEEVIRITEENARRMYRI